MQGRNFRLGVAVVTLVLGTGLGVGTANASTGTAATAAVPVSAQTVLVLSDTIRFSGVAIPSPVAATYSLVSNQCSVVSDGENLVFPCTINLQFSLVTRMGVGNVNGPDGVVHWNFMLTPTGGGNFTMVDTCATGAALNCYEIDSDGGVTSKYPASMSGNLTITPISGSPNLKVTGTINVFETPNSP
jgi:hypothetical protein